MGSEEIITKVPCPDTMPTFSADNPVQALYLKKRGVERLLNRDVGRTLGYSFVTEKRANIANESMLIERSESFDDDFYLPRLETIEDYSETSEKEQDAATITTATATITGDSKCSEVSRYDSDEESDWSLPGIEPMSEIRYVYSGEMDNSQVFYDDGHFYDSERRERKTLVAPEDPRKIEQQQVSALGFLTQYFASCNSEEHLTIYDWIRCA